MNSLEIKTAAAMYYQESAATIYKGHAIEVLKSLPGESVQMCMTSPPYWGLRNYAGGSDIVWKGEEKCEHVWEGSEYHEHRASTQSGKTRTTERFYGEPSRKFNGDHQKHVSNVFCSKCHGWRGQLGLEPTPELYVEHLMMIFREVKRVLRKDGSFYLNLSDSFSGSGCSIQPKCMACIPERVMFAMIEDGWILRNKIVWHKPNSMPSSVKDRFSTTYEFIFFFVKCGRYYFDLDAVREPHKTQSLERYQRQVNFDLFGRGPQPQSFNLRVHDVKRGKAGTTAQAGELKASPEEIEKYEYPEKRHGSSHDLRAGFDRLTKHDQAVDRTGNVSYTDPLHTRDYSPKGKNPGDIFENRQKHEDADLGAQSPARKKHSGYFGEDGQPLVDFANGKNPGDYWELTTQPYKGAHFAVYPEKLCVRPIKASSRVGDVVLDPFCGSGTTGVVAKKLGRKAILIDCVERYCKLARERISKVASQPELPT